MVNYKGIYFGDNNEKFTDPETGAHFRYKDMCQRLLGAKEQRKIIDRQLGIIFLDETPEPESHELLVTKEESK